MYLNLNLKPWWYLEGLILPNMVVLGEKSERGGRSFPGHPDQPLHRGNSFRPHAPIISLMVLIFLTVLCVFRGLLTTQFCGVECEKSPVCPTDSSKMSENMILV